MAETPLTPGAPGSSDPVAGAPDPASSPEGSSERAASGVSEVSVEPAAEELAVEEPAVEGWSGTPIAVSAEEAIARPGSGPIEVSLTPAPPAAADPEPVPAPPEPAPSPAIATTLEIPAAEGSPPGEGGEFDLLVEKLRTWFAEADIGGHWQKLRGPLKGVALLLVAVLALRLYARVVGTLDGIPVVSGLLELTGLIYLLRFSCTRLLRTGERERVLADWKQRWQAFSGRS